MLNPVMHGAVPFLDAVSFNPVKLPAPLYFPGNDLFRSAKLIPGSGIRKPLALQCLDLNAFFPIQMLVPSVVLSIFFLLQVDGLVAKEKVQ